MSRTNVATALVTMSLIGILLASTVSYRNEAKQAQDRIAMMRTQAPDLVKTIARIGFMSGCTYAMIEDRRTTPQDPLFPVFQDECLQLGARFANDIKFNFEK